MTKELILGLVLGVTAWAQVNASITGQVADVSGAPVRGVTVTVKSLETGAVRTTSTDESGNYLVLSLPLGAQEVRAEKTGFWTKNTRQGSGSSIKTLGSGIQSLVDIRYQNVRSQARRCENVRSSNQPLAILTTHGKCMQKPSPCSVTTGIRCTERIASFTSS